MRNFAFVFFKLQFTHASRSSHSWLSKQPQLVHSSKLVVASLSCPELGTAQPQLVIFFVQFCICNLFCANCHVQFAFCILLQLPLLCFFVQSYVCPMYFLCKVHFCKMMFLKVLLVQIVFTADWFNANSYFNKVLLVQSAMLVS